MTKHRSHSAEFKRQVAEEFIAGETLHALVQAARRLAQADPYLGWQVRGGRLRRGRQAADLIQEYEARIAAFERMVGRQALEIEFLKGALKQHPGREARLRPSSPARRHLRHRGCQLMGLARSTFYDTPPVHLGVDELVARIGAICDEFECYGYRRVGAALRHQGIMVNHKKMRRLMREHEPAAEAASALRCHDRQRPCRTDLSRPGQGSCCRTARTSSGWRTSPTSPSRAASSIWRRSWMPGRARWSATQSADRSTPALPSRR